jgi:cytochrome P450
MDLPVIPLPRDTRCPLHPPAEFDAWRDAGLQQAMWHGQLFWVVNRYSDIRATLTDPRVSAGFSSFEQQIQDNADVPQVFARMDDPEHNRLRRMITSDFTARRVTEMRPHIQELVDGFLQTMVEKGAPADLVRDFALPVPSMVICRLLGVPYADHEFFEVNSAKSLDMSIPEEDRVTGSAAVYGYISELLRRKRSEPGDDLITRLAARVEQGDMSHATASMTSFIMLQAGHETTASMIALGALALIQHRNAFERLSNTEDPTLIANAVDELMRYLSVVHSLVERTALEDMTIGAQHVRAGDRLLVNIPAGNWDPDYAKNPDVFDIDRNTSGHLGFGYGVHQCIGLNLARAELQIALSSLVRRMPDLRLAVPAEQLEFKSDHAIYGIQELPVTW